MEIEQREKFTEALKKLCKEFNVKNAAFAGNDETTYIGLSCLEDKPSMGEIFESANNIGRLWQGTRNIIRDLLDDFEKRK